MAKLSKMKTLINDFFSSEPPVLTEAEENALVSASMIPGAVPAHCIFVAMSKTSENVYFETLATGVDSAEVLGDKSCLIRLSLVGKTESSYTKFFKSIGQSELGDYLLERNIDDEKPIPVLIGFTLAKLSVDTVAITGSSVRSIIDIDNVVSSFPEFDDKYLADFSATMDHVYSTQQQDSNYLYFKDALDMSNDDINECRKSQHDLSYNYHSAMSRRSMYALRQSEPSSDYSLDDARNDLKVQTLDGDEYKSSKNVEREAKRMENENKVTIDDVSDLEAEAMKYNEQVLSKESIKQKDQLSKEQIEEIALTYAKKSTQKQSNPKKEHDFSDDLMP